MSKTLNVERGADSQQRMVRLSGRKLIEYRKHLHREMEMATCGMQDAADRLGDAKYPTALADLERQAIRFRAAGLNHMRTIGKAGIEVSQPNVELSDGRREKP